LISLAVFLASGGAYMILLGPTKETHPDSTKSQKRKKDFIFIFEKIQFILSDKKY